MTRIICTLGLAAACTLTLAAQPPSTPAQTQPAAPADGSTVTVTGCLRTGEAPGTFVLANVTFQSTNVPSKDSASHHDATPQRDRPTTPATAATGQGDRPAGETLRLAGAAAKLKLDAHVGHTITVTGMIAPHDPIVRPAVILPDAPERGDTTSRKSNPTATEPSPPRVLNMRSFTHVTNQCT